MDYDNSLTPHSQTGYNWTPEWVISSPELFLLRKFLIWLEMSTAVIAFVINSPYSIFYFSPYSNRH
jgi:hypothetical protein